MAKKKKTLEKNKKNKTGRIKKRPRREYKEETYKKKRKGKRAHSRSTSQSTFYYYQSPCPRCGHRCCRRYYEEVKRRTRKSDMKRTVNRTVKTGLKRRNAPIKGSKIVQIGSVSMMLSPLCEKTSGSPDDDTKALGDEYCEITPEMIYEALRKLTMWKYDVDTLTLLYYIKVNEHTQVQKNYPVCQDVHALEGELLVKLDVAVIVGIISETLRGRWQLSCALFNKQLDINHVSLFWRTYANTMKPIAMKTVKKNKTTTSQGQQSNNKFETAVHIVDDDQDDIL